MHELVVLLDPAFIAGVYTNSEWNLAIKTQVRV